MNRLIFVSHEHMNDPNFEMLTRRFLNDSNEVIVIGTPMNDANKDVQSWNVNRSESEQATGLGLQHMSPNENTSKALLRFFMEAAFELGFSSEWDAVVITENVEEISAADLFGATVVRAFDWLQGYE